MNPYNLPTATAGHFFEESGRNDFSDRKGKAGI